MAKADDAGHSYGYAKTDLLEVTSIIVPHFADKHRLDVLVGYSWQRIYMNKGFGAWNARL